MLLLLDLHKAAVEFDQVAVGGADFDDFSVPFRRDLVQDLHSLDDAQRLAGFNLAPHLHKRLCTGRRGGIEHTHHGGLDLKRIDIERYRALVAKLGLRK